MNLRIAHGTLLLALLGTAGHAADIYRSTAPDGTVSYSDRPQGADSQFVIGHATRYTCGGRQRRAGSPRTRALRHRRKPLRSRRYPKVLRLRSCVSSGRRTAKPRARRQERYTLSRRLFRTNAAGEREYLDDAAVAEARAKAAADVQDWCG